MELDKARYIAIEGPIGIGKTSLVQLLGEYFNAHTVLETVEDNPFLKEFYRNRERYAFQTEMFFLLSRYRQQMSLSQYNLFNRVTITDYIFDRNRIFAYINLNNDEIRLYEDVYSILRNKIPKPDLLIYLQADIDTLKKRINMRGRAFEKNISDEYLDGVNKAFNNYFFHYTQSPILIVNANDINFVERKEDLKDLITKKCLYLSGVL